jgi:hypothetical protein
MSSDWWNGFNCGMYFCLGIWFVNYWIVQPIKRVLVIMKKKGRKNERNGC